MKILYVTTIGSTMNFFSSFIRQLLDEGHTVDIATNESSSKVPRCYKEWGCTVYQIDTSRSPLNMGNIKAITRIKALVEKGKYDLVHCHTPVAAMCTRLACCKDRKKGTKVFYTAHGFHFYEGAPLKNWLLYYPVEKICSYFTDVLITINHEDYALAKKKMKAKRVEYVPGVGVDLKKSENVQVDRMVKRREIGVPEDAFVLLSVGELNANKNHQIIIKALAEVNNPSVHYVIAGMGDKKDALLELAKRLGVSQQVHLLGYRQDIPELNKAADVFCFPSYREGLAIAPIEAMASGLPLLTSNIRGVNDYSIDGVTGYMFKPPDVNGFSEGIKRLKEDDSLRIEMGKNNIECAQQYSLARINTQMREVYKIERC